MDTTMTPIERLERVAVLFREILDLLPAGDVSSAFTSLHDSAVCISLNRSLDLLVEAGGFVSQSGPEGGPPTHEHAYLTLPSGARVDACRPIPGAIVIEDGGAA